MSGGFKARRKRKIAARSKESYLSRDAERRRAQLSNLPNLKGRTTSTSWQPGQSGGYKHGGRVQEIARQRLDSKAREIFDALSCDAPLRDTDGGLPAADGALVRLLAECLIRLEGVSGYLRDHGLLDPKGEVRPAVELEGRLRREAAGYLDQLGMSPMARSRLGLDLARSLDLAQAWAQEDAEERADADGDAVEEEGDDAA